MAIRRFVEQSGGVGVAANVNRNITLCSSIARALASSASIVNAP